MAHHLFLNRTFANRSTTIRVLPCLHLLAAPVARLMRFYNIPLLTAGGLALDFTKPKTGPESEFHLLVKTGYSFAHMAHFMGEVFKK